MLSVIAIKKASEFPEAFLIAYRDVINSAPYCLIEHILFKRLVQQRNYYIYLARIFSGKYFANSLTKKFTFVAGTEFVSVIPLQDSNR